MSRGPGTLQRRILEMLEEQPEHKLSRGQLRLFLPDVDRANLRRALRSLASMEYVHERTEYLELDPATDQWAPRWVFLVRPETLGTEELDTLDSPAAPEAARS